MKKVLLALICLLCLPGLALSASPNALGESKRPDGYPPALPYGQEPQQQAPAQALMPLPDYLGQDNVPLTKNEKKALGLSKGWAGHGAAPVLSFVGFTYSDQLKTVYGCTGYPKCTARFWDKNGKPDFDNPPK